MGKTCAQILQMARVTWLSFYKVNLAAQSNCHMISMFWAHVYTLAALEGNKKLIVINLWIH